MLAHMQDFIWEGVTFYNVDIFDISNILVDQKFGPIFIFLLHKNRIFF